MNGTATMLRMQLRVEQRIFWRNRSSVFFTFILPIALLFALAISNDPISTAPFIAALGILSTGFQGLAIQLSMHRDQGVLKQIMATPLPPWILIFGKALSTMIVITIEVLIVIAASVILFGAPLPHHPLLLAMMVLIGTGAFVALGFALASIIPTSDSAPAITNAAYLGLILMTAVVHNVDGLPHALRTAGEALPLTNLFVPIHHAWMGGWHPADWWSALLLVGWGTAGVAWSVRRFRWEPAGER